MRAVCVVAVAAGLAGLAGCDAGGGPAAPAPALPPVELVEVTVDGLDAAIREKKGQVLVVDFWALWCTPCVARFPEVVGLHRRYAGRGLTCVSVSVDDPPGKEGVRAFLLREGATFPNFLLTDRTTDDSRRKLADRYRYGPAIPHAAVFARDGELVWAGSGLAPCQFEEMIAREVARKQ